MKITAIRIAECRVPLPMTLRLGSTSITTRDYLAIRLETDTEIDGDARVRADWKLTCELQQALTIPIAAGEDVAEPRELKNLVAGIGILRVDATTCGGITGAIEAIHHAFGAGRNVLPHVFAPLHVHLACAFPAIEAVEYIPEESSADPLSSMLKNPPMVKDGEIHTGNDPGVGIVLDWESIERTAVRSRII